jgi:hypothetical protein
MASREDMQGNNDASPMNQSQRRALRQRADNQIDFIDDQIDKYKDAQLSGRINNTKDSRAVKAEIDRLNNNKQQVQDQLDRDLDEDRQRRNEGQYGSRSSGNGMPSFSEREGAAGLNDTMSGRGQDDPTMDEREAAAGLRGTTSGRDFSDKTERQTRGDDGELPDEKDNDDPLGTFGVIICINGRPHSASIYGQIGPKLGD